MNRSARRHRSTKVPNVKLRPAPPPKEATTSTRSREQDAQAEDEAMRHYRALRKAHASGKQKDEKGGQDDDDDDDEDEEEGKDNDDQAPLVGCVICTTGFDEEKVNLHECAIALGATVEGNLTESATHLIASEPGSDKYYWAVKLGIPILRPAWLYDLRARWQKAIPIRFVDLIEEHRLDTFQGLTMAMAGVTDVEKRKKIRADVKSASGQTPLTFKLDNSFTHLLCEDVKGSQTLQAVNKYRQKAVRYRRRGEEVPSDVPDAGMMQAALKLKLVWVEWVQDCLAVQGCIEERFYSINEPRMSEMQRQRLIESILAKRAEKAKYTAATMTSCKQALKDPVQAAVVQEAKKGRSDGDGKALKHNIPRPTMKRPNVAIEQLMEHINHSKGVEKQITPPRTNSEPSHHQAASEENIEAQTKPEAEQAITVETTAASHNNELTKSRASESSAVAEEEETDDTLELDEAAGLGKSFSEKSLAQVSFRVNLCDDSKNQRVWDALQKHSVSQLLELDDPRSADFHILPLTVSDRDVHEETPHLGTPVTHFFIERCLTEGRVVRLDESFALQPSRHSFPLPGAEAANVALTGLGSNEDGPDRHQVMMALEAAGVKTASIFRRSVHTHLLVGKYAEGSSSSVAKVERAKKWGVPIVGLDFVERIFREGIVAPSPVTVANGSLMSRSPMAGDDSTFSEDASTMLRETQALDMITDVPLPISSAVEHNDGKNGVRTLNNLQQGSVEDTKAECCASDTGQIPQETFSEKNNQPELETQQSLELGTQILSASTDQVMALLKQHRMASSASDVGTSTVSPSTLNGRKVRRLPPSMREQFRERSGTPLAEETPERQMADGTTMDSMQLAEEILAKGREQEARAFLQSNYLNATQSLNAGNDEQASMRVVYDDPIARRERRKIAAMIDKALKERQEDAQGDDVPIEAHSTASQPSMPHKHMVPQTNDNSPLKRTRTTVAGHSPTIKARRQPGTAGRDVA